MRDQLIEKVSNDKKINEENYFKVRALSTKYKDNRMALTRIFNDLFLASDTKKFNKELGEHTKDGIGMIIGKLPLTTLKVLIHKLAACYYNINEHETLENIAKTIGVMYKLKYQNSSFDY